MPKRFVVDIPAMPGSARFNGQAESRFHGCCRRACEFFATRAKDGFASYREAGEALRRSLRESEEAGI